jgi:hypothetical protein
MPYTLNGFGTKYYGNRERAEDGSYITTLWVTALYVPLFPLASYRVKPTGKGTNLVVHSSQNYLTRRVPLCWEQVWHVYMIGAPILVIAAGLIWSSVKEDRAKDSFVTQMKTASGDVERARSEADKLVTDCFHLVNSTKSNQEADAPTLRQGLHEHCGQAIPAVDRYLEEVGSIQQVISRGLALGSLRNSDRSTLNAYQNLWRIRRHQGEEMKQMLVCFANLTPECKERIVPLSGVLDKEDKQACVWLASVNQKCE